MKQKRKETPLDVKLAIIGLGIGIVYVFFYMFVGTVEGKMYLNEEQEVCGYSSAGGFKCSSQLDAYKDIIGNHCEYDTGYKLENKQVCGYVADTKDAGTTTWLWDRVLQDNSDAWTDGEKIYKKSK